MVGVFHRFHLWCVVLPVVAWNTGPVRAGCKGGGGRVAFVSSRVIDDVLATWSAMQDRRGVLGAEATHQAAEGARWAKITGVSDTLRLKIGRRFAV